jgi:hypothetical protein
MGVDDWLAAMPSPNEIRQEIIELEARIERLRLALRLAGEDAKPPPSRAPRRYSGTRRRPRAISDERVAVLRAVAAAGADGITPAALAKVLEIELNVAQTRVSRMVSAGQIERATVDGRRTYRLPGDLTAWKGGEPLI